jgi:ParB family chromosome partitioning protein
MIDVRRRGLGRGLGALIPSASPALQRAKPEPETSAPIDAIAPNPYQPREVFDDEALNELSASIREKGVLQPLVVRRVADGRYQLIAGERRFRAAQRAGLNTVPILVRDADDGEALELALIENLQRENLNPIEEARAYERLANEFHLGQEEIARRVGKSRSAITNALRLLGLPAEVLAQLESGALSAAHARTLLALDSAGTQREVADNVITRRLSVRDTEQLVRERAARSAADVEQRAVEARLAQALGTRVHLRHNRNGSGKIVIEYYSLDGLDGLLARLGANE